MRCSLEGTRPSVAIWQQRGDEGPQVRELSFATREAAMYWVVHFALARRNLTEEQQKYLRGLKYRAEVKAHGGTGANQHTAAKAQKDKICLSAPKSSNPTRDRIAQEEGVSPGSVRNAELFSKAVDRLDETGVVTKAEILGGKQKRSAASVVKAGKLATEGKIEEASQKAMIAAKALDFYEQQAKERQREHGGTAPGKKKTLGTKSAQVFSDPGRATEKAGEALGVSSGSVKRAKRVLTQGEVST